MFRPLWNLAYRAVAWCALGVVISLLLSESSLLDDPTLKAAPVWAVTVLGTVHSGRRLQRRGLLWPKPPTDHETTSFDKQKAR